MFKLKKPLKKILLQKLAKYNVNCIFLTNQQIIVVIITTVLYIIRHKYIIKGERTKGGSNRWKKTNC